MEHPFIVEVKQRVAERQLSVRQLAKDLSTINPNISMRTIIAVCAGEIRLTFTTYAQLRSGMQRLGYSIEYTGEHFYNHWENLHGRRTQS